MHFGKLVTYGFNDSFKITYETNVLFLNLLQISKYFIKLVIFPQMAKFLQQILSDSIVDLKRYAEKLKK